MVRKNLSIEIDSKYKALIVNAIQESLKRYYIQYKSEYKTKTNNGRHTITWDFINSGIDLELPKDRFEIIDCKRGIWELILIYDKQTKWLFSLMKDKRFSQLRKQVRKNKVHYLEALGSINNELNTYLDQQITLFELQSDERLENIENTVSSMLSMLKNEVIRYCLISFTNSYEEITSISASIFNYNLSIQYEESWNDYVSVDFNTIIDIVADSKDNNDEELEDIELPLKVNINEDIELPHKEDEKQDVQYNK